MKYIKLFKESTDDKWIDGWNKLRQKYKDEESNIDDILIEYIESEQCDKDYHLGYPTYKFKEKSVYDTVVNRLRSFNKSFLRQDDNLLIISVV